MRAIHQGLRSGAVHAGEADRQAHGNAKAMNGRAEIDFGIHRQIGGQSDVLLARHDLDGANEAGRIARCKHLLGVGSRALSRRAEGDLQAAIIAACLAVTAAGGVRAGGVKHFVKGSGHGVFLSTGVEETSCWRRVRN